MNRLVKILNIGIIVILFAGICFAQETESVTITTYYPAPQATYRMLRLVPNHEPPTCDSDHIGALHYDDGGSLTKGLYYCDGEGQWKSAAGGEPYWTKDEIVSPPPDAYLYTNNSDWNMGIGITNPAAKLHIEGGGLLFTGATGSTPVSGAGTRLMWIPERAAFRAGRVEWIGDPPKYGDSWDGTNIGDYSFATGYNTIASGSYSAAFGEGAKSEGIATTAIGNGSRARGHYSTAMGRGPSTVTPDEVASSVFGYANVSSGTANVGMGVWGTISGDFSFAAGHSLRALAETTVAMGQYARADDTRSVSINLEDTTDYCETTQAGQFKICGNLQLEATACDPADGICTASGTTYSDALITAEKIEAFQIIATGPPKTFKIPHPDPNKPEGTFLKHSSVEVPTAGDNIYRWTVEVVSGEAIIELPDYYKFLNKDDMVCITAKGHFGTAYGEVSEAQEAITIRADSDGKYNVLLIGTRKDKYATSAWQGPEVFVKSE